MKKCYSLLRPARTSPVSGGLFRAGTEMRGFPINTIFV